MNSDEREHLESLRKAHTARLRVLQRQQATKGLIADPAISIEIDEIQQQLARIEQQLPRIVLDPVSFAFKHNLNGGFQAFSADVNVKNFIVEVDSVNPYTASAPLYWMAGIEFRIGYRVWIRSDRTWGYGYDVGQGWKTKKQDFLILTPFFTDAGATNRLKLIVQDHQGQFFVNDTRVGILDVSASLVASDIKIGISEKEYKKEGETSHFKNVTIYELL